MCSKVNRITYRNINILCEDVLENLRNAIPCFMSLAVELGRCETKKFRSRRHEHLRRYDAPFAYTLYTTCIIKTLLIYLGSIEI